MGDGRLDLDQLVLVDPGLNVLVAVAGEAPGRGHPGVRAALFAKTDHLEIEGSVLGDRIVRVTVPVVGRGQPVGVLQIGMRLQPIEMPGGALGFALLYVLTCGAVIALFGWAQLRSSLVAPIERLRTGTGRIAAGELGHQLDEENTAELQALVTSLNTMSAGLKSAQDALIRSERLAGVGRRAGGGRARGPPRSTRAAAIAKQRLQEASLQPAWHTLNRHRQRAGAAFRSNAALNR